MEIRSINKCDTYILEAINKMLPQLSDSASTLSESALKELLSSPGTKLFVVAEGNKYYGMLVLASYMTLTGIKTWIEDVVVDKNSRGKGIGRSLTLHALDAAKELGAKALNLTSRPSRVAANELYKKLGFELRESNVYRYDLGNS